MVKVMDDKRMAVVDYLFYLCPSKGAVESTKIVATAEEQSLWEAFKQW